MAPEVLHLIFVLVGLGLGWYLKHHSLGIPPDILQALQKLLAQKQQQDGHGLLKDFLNSLSAPPGPPRS
jgi:hypothetical protein